MMNNNKKEEEPHVDSDLLMALGATSDSKPNLKLDLLAIPSRHSPAAKTPRSSAGSSRNRLSRRTS